MEHFQGLCLTLGDVKWLVSYGTVAEVVYGLHYNIPSWGVYHKPPKFFSHTPRAMFVPQKTKILRGIVTFQFDRQVEDCPETIQKIYSKLEAKRLDAVDVVFCWGCFG